MRASGGQGESRPCEDAVPFFPRMRRKSRRAGLPGGAFRGHSNNPGAHLLDNYQQPAPDPVISAALRPVSLKKGINADAFM